MGWKRKAGIGCGGVVILLAAAAGTIFYLQPWVPAIVVVEPGPTGRRVTDDGLLANYYPSREVGRRPAVLLLGGSEGGLGESSQRNALRLQAEGFAVMNLSYYRAPGQPHDLEMVPLETFAKGLAWLRRQPDVDPGRIGIVGGSKGAEAALLAATRDPGIRAVVAGMPSSVAWQGFSWERRGEFGSSWSEHGRPVDYLVFGGWRWTLDVTSIYTAALQKLPSHPGAAIPIERIAAPVLLLCGEADSLWPSCQMARQLQNRARERGRPAVTLLAYPDAGHAVFGQPWPPGDPHYGRLDSLGGTDEGNNRARIHGWPRVIAFLKSALGN
jgi:dienelactone hydrolase